MIIMTIHVPQSVEAAVEIKELMMVQDQLLNAQNSRCSSPFFSSLSVSLCFPPFLYRFGNVFFVFQAMHGTSTRCPISLTYAQLSGSVPDSTRDDATSDVLGTQRPPHSSHFETHPYLDSG